MCGLQSTASLAAASHLQVLITIKINNSWCVTGPIRAFLSSTGTHLLMVLLVQMPVQVMYIDRSRWENDCPWTQLIYGGQFNGCCRKYISKHITPLIKAKRHACLNGAIKAPVQWRWACATAEWSAYRLGRENVHGVKPREALLQQDFMWLKVEQALKKCCFFFLWWLWWGWWWSTVNDFNKKNVLQLQKL